MQLDEEILSRALLWTRQQEESALISGLELSSIEREMARQAGVRDVDRVRLLPVAAMPSPEDAVLQAAMQATGFGLGDASGLTLGHAILLLRPDSEARTSTWRDENLIGHELVHVAQVERLGLEGFLRLYLEQCLGVGYDRAPLELEARGFRFRAYDV